MADVERLPKELENALKSYTDSQYHSNTIKNLRELQKFGFIEIKIKTGWSLTEKGKEYLLSIGDLSTV